MTDAAYLTRAELARYASVSERQLQTWTNLPPAAALPCFRFGRAVRYKRSDFDAWFAQYRTRGKAALVRALRDFGLDPELEQRRPLARAGRPARPAVRAAR